MDGVALLERLVEQHPRIVRIVLSGHAERESLMRGAAVAHQYLSKPCEPDVLRTKLTQAFGLARCSRTRGSTSGLPAQAASGAVDGLRPRRCRSSIRRTPRPRGGCGHRARPGHDGQVLQLANATCFGSESGRLATCRDAVELLGLDTDSRPDPVDGGLLPVRADGQLLATMSMALARHSAGEPVRRTRSRRTRARRRSGWRKPRPRTAARRREAGARGCARHRVHRRRFGDGSATAARSGRSRRTASAPAMPKSARTCWGCGVFPRDDCRDGLASPAVGDRHARPLTLTAVHAADVDRAPARTARANR